MEIAKRVIVTDYYQNTRDMATFEDFKLSCFAYGKPGAGKTKFLGTFPKPH